jgi:hypothetical protein
MARFSVIVRLDRFLLVLGIVGQVLLDNLANVSDVAVAAAFQVAVFLGGVFGFLRGAVAGKCGVYVKAFQVGWSDH